MLGRIRRVGRERLPCRETVEQAHARRTCHGGKRLPVKRASCAQVVESGDIGALRLLEKSRQLTMCAHLLTTLREAGMKQRDAQPVLQRIRRSRRETPHREEHVVAERMLHPAPQSREAAARHAAADRLHERERRLVPAPYEQMPAASAQPARRRVACREPSHEIASALVLAARNEQIGQASAQFIAPLVKR